MLDMPIKHNIRQWITFLCIGIGTTILSAWFLELCGIRKCTYSQSTHSTTWLFDAPEEWLNRQTTEELSVKTYHAVGRKMTIAWSPTLSRWGDFNQEEIYVGLPCLCLRRRAAYTDQDDVKHNVAMPFIDRGIVIRDAAVYQSSWESRALPLQPLWIGFAINVLFYAVLWRVVIAMIWALRSLKRYKQGYCPMCGYNLLGDYTSTCPECGYANQK